MFDNLVESNRKGRRDVRGTMGGIFASTVFQSILIAGAVYATMGVAQEVTQVAMDTIELVLDEPEQEKPEEEPPPVVKSLNPPPKGFQVLAAPSDIPTEIPPINLEERFDPRDYSGVGVEGGVFSGVEGGTGPVDLSQVFAEAVVDEPPERISCPQLDYPRMMQQASIQGQVVLRFVVDTDGRVQRGTVESMSSTHRAFETPARDMISKCLFRPGRVRGRAVRVLVQMPIIFTLSGR